MGALVAPDELYMGEFSGGLTGIRSAMFPCLFCTRQLRHSSPMWQPDDITKALEEFDGKHVAPLKALLANDLSPGAEAELIAAVPGAGEVAATWLVKALVEKGRLGAGHIATLFDRFAQVSEPDAALHLLQCAQHAPDAAVLLRPHLPPYYSHNRILLRVWAFDAYCRGASPEEDLTERIRQGLASRHGAMRARSKALAQEFGVDLENGHRPPHL